MPSLYSLDPKQTLRGKIEILDNATFIPLDNIARPKRTLLGGVLREDGSYVENSKCYVDQNRSPTRIPSENLRNIAQFRSGKWLYGGRFDTRFGHFLVETIARLWALDHLPFDVEGVVFMQGSAARAVRPKRRVASMAHLFGLIQDVPKPEIIIRPVTFETLVVPPQGCGSGELGAGCPEFRHFMRSRFSATPDPHGSKRLYMSRSALDAAPGQVLFERDIETALAAQGYRIFHPQDHDIAEQIAQIRAADHIVGVEGSAFHLVSYAAHANAQIGMIRRRRFEGGPLAHCRGFFPDQTHDLDALSYSFTAEDKPREIGNAVLDFQRLETQLKETGFVDASFSLPHHNQNDEEREIERVRQRILA